MKHKLIAIWKLLRSKNYIVVTDFNMIYDCSPNIINRTIDELGIYSIECKNIQNKMDSVVEEVNSIINGKV
jgi:hypothetical protein